MPSEPSDVERYWIVRRAVRDAIWDVIGTLVTVLVAGFLLFFGLAVLAQGVTGDVATRGPLPIVVGAVLVVLAVAVVLREFRLWPFD